MPEQRHIQTLDPACLPPARADTPAPPTVAGADQPLPALPMSLDEAIRASLDNSEVVRVLAGVTAASSGATIYDPAISNTQIDQEQGRFDPVLEVQNNFAQAESPTASLGLIDPTRTEITGVATEQHRFNLGLSKQTVTGGTARLGVTNDHLRLTPGIFPLNPQDRSSVELSFTQPLLRGGGIDANMVPIVIARINTDRSFFQLKSSMQRSVLGVIEGYWNLVTARTVVWVRQQQAEQAQWAFEQTQAESKVGRKNIADLSQTRVALANFRASLIGAEADVLQREAALRNILGLPPADSGQIVPVTPPSTDRRRFDWDALVSLAEQRRPDLIELKLIIEADQQLLIQARNQAMPQLDAVMLYRWNGLEGEMPRGDSISSDPGQFTDWTLGINFSVPVGLRQPRAALRGQELIIARDWANLRQGLHAVVHDLALDLRNLDQLYEQYGAFQETREAAHINLQAQLAQYRTGRTIYLNVLLAISNWGDAIIQEAQSLAQYNTQLANLEVETGTILETHGIRFTEERFASLGPLGRLGKCRLYPSSLRPDCYTDRYPTGTEAAEQSFGLEDPVKLKGR